ncbi:MAG: SpoIIE family protein phosphatase [Clostridiales Family XIII bacterium]|jgi:sigma-B regulation protein RsbU (phosphoserine phosphatase)|nr:SpoIIE family protein phosphatase [Clostridiales Family XIII bacterium]
MSNSKYQRSIYAKVRRKMIFAALLSAFAVFVVAAAALFFVRMGVADVSKELGDQAADNSVDNMTELTETSLQDTARNRAMLSDAKLQTVSRAVNVIADNATAVMSHPERYKDRPIPPPDPQNKGKIVAQVVYAADAAADKLVREVGLLGNLQDMQLALLNTEDTIASMQIGSETGIMVMIDEMSDVKTSPFDPRVRPWYVAAKEEQGLIWTDVFDDAFGRGLSMTCGVPYYDADGRIVGVVSGGMLLSTLNDTVAGARVGKSGKTFIVNETGDILISEDVSKDASGNIVKENLLKSDSESMRDVAKSMTEGKSGIERVSFEGTEYFMAYSPLTARPWSFAVLVETGEVLSPVEVMRQDISNFTDRALAEIQTIFFIALGAFLFLLLGIALFEFHLSRKVSAGITAPIITLTQAVQGLLDREELELDLRIETGDEIEELANTFTNMTARLKDYIRHLTVVTAEKGRIETELNVAKRIQASMLPCIFPPFPEMSEFDLYAIMRPAKEVGGDFYDFFLIDKNTLCIIVADVSGKGVPAALFMVIAKILIKNNAQAGMRPSEVFETVNNLLCENNEEEMFVTAFMGYLDIPTGTFTFVNAGHNPPIVRQGDSFQPIKMRPGFVLAGLANVRYIENRIALKAGDAICMYTDGVTEATNGEDELYSLARLIDAANRESLEDLTAFTMNIKASIAEFESGVEQADDITLLSFRYDGKNAAGKPRVAANHSALQTESAGSDEPRAETAADGDGGSDAPHAETAADEDGGSDAPRAETAADEDAVIAPPCDPDAEKLNILSGSARELEIDADKTNLNRVLSFITEPLRARDVGAAHISQIEVAAEEVFVNIASYAYTPERGRVKIRCFLGDVLVLIFEDEGKPFDPLSLPDPDINLFAEERTIGGLGIFMTKKIMDKVSYRYEDGKNILTLGKKLS